MIFHFQRYFVPKYYFLGLILTLHINIINLLYRLS
jgi:hypothetical protein